MSCCFLLLLLKMPQELPETYCKEVYKDSFVDYLCAGVVVLGLTLFTLGDVALTPEYEWRGLIFVILSLGTGSLVGNGQEYIMKRWRSSETEMLLYMGLIGSVLDLVWLLISGEFTPAFSFCNEHPSTYAYMIASSVLAYMSLCFVMIMVNHFGATVATLITSLRKFITIALSILLFGKPINRNYMLGAFLVFFGIVLRSMLEHTLSLTMVHKTLTFISTFSYLPRPLQRVVVSVTNWLQHRMHASNKRDLAV